MIILLAASLMACGGNKESKTDNSVENTSASEGRAEEVKLDQYMVAGRQLYMTHCSSCHQPDGKGLAKLFPPLAGSDYLDAHFEEVPCIIRNGIKGEVTVNGVVYNQPMPGIPSLKPLDIAEITTYIYNSWGQEKGIVNVKDVEKMLEGCGI